MLNTEDMESFIAKAKKKKREISPSSDCLSIGALNIQDDARTHGEGNPLSPLFQIDEDTTCHS